VNWDYSKGKSFGKQKEIFGDKSERSCRDL
jgi:hypothetical protein